MRKVADSTVRRLSLYLRFLDDFEGQGVETVSSEALAQRGGTTSAQVRKDLSFFGSFGKRGLGYYVPELAQRLRQILGLGRRYRVAMIGAGKIGSALVQYRGFTAARLRHRGHLRQRPGQDRHAVERADGAADRPAGAGARRRSRWTWRCW